MLSLESDFPNFFFPPARDAGSRSIPLHALGIHPICSCAMPEPERLQDLASQFPSRIIAGVLVGARLAMFLVPPPTPSHIALSYRVHTGEQGLSTQQKSVGPSWVEGATEHEFFDLHVSEAVSNQKWVQDRQLLRQREPA